MHAMTVFLRRFLLALTLCASVPALASPIYRVSVDTTGYSGQGLMDFNFLANLGAAPATALLDGFSGAFGGEAGRSGGVSGAIPGPLTFDNQAGGSILTQTVDLGGWFSFNLRFAGDFDSTDAIDGTRFSVSLYNSDFSAYIGSEGSLVSFDLLPPANGAGGGVLAAPPGSLATVAAVPEPATLLLVLGGLGLAAITGRRRTGRAN